MKKNLHQDKIQPSSIDLIAITKLKGLNYSSQAKPLLLKRYLQIKIIFK
jgi:hypothetical protein